MGTELNNHTTKTHEIFGLEILQSPNLHLTRMFTEILFKYHSHAPFVFFDLIILNLIRSTYSGNVLILM